MNPFVRYARWLHTGFPAGGVEPLPEVGEAGETPIAGLRVVGDLLGTPLLKLAVASGAAAGRAIADEGIVRRPDVLDVVVVGAGPAGISAALEGRARGLEVAVFDARGPFATIVDFPAGKPIFLYPSTFEPESPLALEGDTRERLLANLEQRLAGSGLVVEAARLTELVRREGVFELRDESGATFARAQRVVLAIGRSGDRRRLGVPGESSSYVRHRLHDPTHHAGHRVVVVGGGDSAVEAALALADAKAKVTLVHRDDAFVRPKPGNRAALEARRASRDLDLRLRADVERFDEGAVVLRGGERLEVDDAFVLIGRDPPHALLRRLGLPLVGERTRRHAIGTALALALAAFVYVWKSGGELTATFRDHGWFPFRMGHAFESPGLGPMARVLAVTLEEPGFYYSALYSLVVLGFGLRRVARTPTPYVRAQTLVLGLVQWLPLFVLPYFLLPYLGQVGAFHDGFGRAFADAFFPVVDYGHGREYWRAFGFVLAFPLFVWNVFASEPSLPWLVVSALQTLVLIPWMIRTWGKGAYCGFICSCGALAETLGDRQRTKMPHGPAWNRLNLLGQAVLFAATTLLVLRIVSWAAPGATLFGVRVGRVFATLLYDAEIAGVRVDYFHAVDVTLAGILGVGLYFAYSGRTWCRFACPLAALMHVYTRAFSRFRIFADASRCIACNQCTTVCHQGIDVMAFAIRGEPMDDPQCVRCSACVSVCPTATLSFGSFRRDGSIALDSMESSPVRLREDGKVGLRVVSR